MRHAWDVWGRDDRLGTMNRVTDQTALRALAVPRSGRRINLCLPLDQPDPPLFGRSRFARRVFERDRNTVEDEITGFDPQGSSQWDSLLHMRAGVAGHYAGIPAGDPRVDGLGIHVLALHGLLLRGVMLDLPAYWEAIGERVDPLTERPVTVVELRAVAQRQCVTFGSGDLLLVRTGWLAAHRQRGRLDEASLRLPTSTGLEGSEEMASFLFDTGFCAIAADNPAVEVTPGDPAVGSLHRRLLPALGMPLGELWDFDELAMACANVGRFECCVVSVPLNIPGGVASPANALAIL